ncbi:unnamed protein product [Brugia pahangi]|uniref:Ovule protein n=1 Tax=Brugia pahangi TaxID=6280 RepID=A0A0N4TL97_BRUPA|nr:unnamed protein product [Brugia pahangi]
MFEYISDNGTRNSIHEPNSVSPIGGKRAKPEYIYWMNQLDTTPKTKFGYISEKKKSNYHFMKKFRKPSALLLPKYGLPLITGKENIDQ